MKSEEKDSASEKKSVWETLSSINVNDHTEKKNGLTYLSWAWAWGMLKKHYPEASFHKHSNEHGVPCFKDENGFAYVAVSVDVENITHTEIFPVLDHRNKAMQNPDSFAVNASLQRALTKAISYHGLGHYIYAGEDLPQASSEPDKPTNGGAAMIKKTFIEFIPMASDMKALLHFYKENESALKTLEGVDKPSHAEVMVAFKKRKEELQQEGDA